MADNWREQIEAQIAWLKADLEPHGGELNDHEKAVVAAIISMQALLDVAVAADALDYLNQTRRIREALDKLREVSE